MDLSDTEFSESLTSSSNEELTQKVSYNNKLPVEITQNFIALFEEAVEQISLLGCAGELPKIEEKMKIERMDKKFENMQTQIFDPTSEELEYQKLERFQMNLNLIKSVFEETVRDLKENNSFNYLIETAAEFERIEVEEKEMMELAQKSRDKLKKIKSDVEIQKETAVKVLKDHTEKVGKCKDDIERIIAQNEMKMKYLDKWQKSREQLWEHNRNAIEKEGLEKIGDLQKEIEKEERVHREIEKYLSLMEKEYTSQIQYWTKRRESESKTMNEKIKILNEDIKEQSVKIADLNKAIEERQSYIEKRSKYEDEERRKRDYKKRRNKAVIKIQSWWRGVMVRKGLGPFAKLMKKKTKEATKKSVVKKSKK